jgi:glycerol-3-phosphate acyltransferase PlsY
MMALALALLVCYLLGSIPTAYWLVKWAKGMDIRAIGSGNVGATNVLRTVGLWAGLAVFAIDILKGVIAAGLIPRWMLGASALGISLACGLAAVLGHDFSCFLRFRGGKGVSTTIGVLLASAPIVAGIVMGVWVLVFVGFRYVSLSSLVSALALPVGQLALRHSLPAVLMGACLSVLIIVRHRANIQRLLGGVEHRAWIRKGS